MKLVFFNRFFPPDASATSQILSDLALHLAGEGIDVHVVTSRVPGGDAPRENVGGVTVHRVAGSVPGPHGLGRRALAYLDYYRGARSFARKALGDGDIAVIKTDPPLLSAAIVPIARWRRARTIVWLQDLFPEVALEYSFLGLRGPVYAAVRRARDESLAGSDGIVAICEAMAQRVAASGRVAPSRLRVIHNWADGHAIVPMDAASSPLRHEWKLDAEFVVAYSGNLGRVHEFGTMLDAAGRLRGRPDIRFAVIGHGPRLEEVRAAVVRQGLPNITFIPHQDRTRLSQSLGAADAHLSILRPEFEGLVHPSKLYGIMAAGRPTLFIGSVTGETARILHEAQAGVSVRTGDGGALVQAIVRMKEDSRGRTVMGHNARRAFEAHYDMPIALGKWRELLRVCGEFPPARVGSYG